MMEDFRGDELRMAWLFTTILTLLLGREITVSIKESHRLKEQIFSHSPMRSLQSNTLLCCFELVT